MSSPSTTRDKTQPSTPDGAPENDDLESGAIPLDLGRLVPALAAPLRIASFWAAIVLPFLYVPLLVAGLSNQAETVTFLGLLGLNLVTLYVGRSYRQ